MRENSIWKKLLFLLILIHVCINAVWIYINNAPPSWDEASHTSIAITIALAISKGNPTAILHASNYYPIFVHFLAAVITSVFGLHLKLIQSTGTIFFALGILLTYLYSNSLFQRPRAAFFSSLVFSICPIVFNESRRMMLDVPLVTLLLASLYFLQKSNLLQNKKLTTAFFICVALVLLTKWTALIFLFFPLLITFFSLIKKRQMKKALAVSLPGILIGILIVTPWYLVNFESLRFLASVNSIGEMGDPTALLSFENYVFYLQKLINYITTPIITFGFFISLSYLFFHKIKHRWLISGIIVVGYIAFTFIQNKDARYIMPIVPFISISIGLFLDFIIFRYKAIGANVVVVFFGISALYALILTIRPPFLEGTRISFQIPLLGAVNIIDLNDSVVKRIDKNISPNQDIIDQLPPGAVATVAYETERINPSTLSLYTKMEQYETRTDSATIITPDPAFLEHEYHTYSFPSNDAIEEYLSKITYVIVSPETTGVQDIKNKKALEQIRNYVISDHDCARFIQTSAPSNISCLIRQDEILETGSDVLVNGKLSSPGLKRIVGPASINCSWGCSFGIVVQPSRSVHFELIKEYRLVNNESLRLYKKVLN